MNANQRREKKEKRRNKRKSDGTIKHRPPLTSCIERNEMMRERAREELESQSLEALTLMTLMAANRTKKRNSKVIEEPPQEGEN
jgi:hypothetical protein